MARARTPNHARVRVSRGGRAGREGGRDGGRRCQWPRRRSPQRVHSMHRVRMAARSGGSDVRRRSMPGSHVRRRVQTRAAAVAEHPSSPRCSSLADPSAAAPSCEPAMLPASTRRHVRDLPQPERHPQRRSCAAALHHTRSAPQRMQNKLRPVRLALHGLVQRLRGTRFKRVPARGGGCSVRTAALTADPQVLRGLRKGHRRAGERTQAAPGGGGGGGGARRHLDSRLHPEVLAILSPPQLRYGGGHHRICTCAHLDSSRCPTARHCYPSAQGGGSQHGK